MPPSISPGEKCARSSSTCARNTPVSPSRVAALLVASASISAARAGETPVASRATTIESDDHRALGVIAGRSIGNLLRTLVWSCICGIRSVDDPMLLQSRSQRRENGRRS